MTDKLFFFPQKPSKSCYKNPYSQNYKDCLEDYFNVVDKDASQSRLKAWSLLKYSTKANIYVLNWVENIPFLKYAFIQYLLVKLAFAIMKARGSKIVWMFHNIQPHQGVNWMTKDISKWLFHNATLIISHSKEATKYAKQYAVCNVVYKCHPIKLIPTETWDKTIDPYDVFIWGAILPYKGIVEFISSPEIQQSELKIKIIGSCKDIELNSRIREYTNDNINFENRRADFSEISANCKSAKYVLFPYIGNCVSSSGALIDTIALGGRPVGPHLGAFIDLNQAGVCLTYKDYKDLLNILTNKKNEAITDIDDFLKNNSWTSFAKFLAQNLKSN